MPNELIHLFGPLSINMFGLMAAIGLLIFYWLLARHPQFKAMHLQESFSSILILGAGVAIIGGKLAYHVAENELPESAWDLFAFWQGGISVLGATVSLILVIPAYLHYKKIPILPFADLISIHIALFQSIARLGCYFAGCCYGATTSVPWAIMYTNTGCLAPLYKNIHPTQLYSALILLGIFFLMYFVMQYRFKKPGQLLCIYLMCMSMERFMVDFWRADRVYFENSIFQSLSIYQWLAIAIFGSASIGLLFIQYRNRRIQP